MDATMKETYKQQLKTELSVWGAQIHLLAAKAEGPQEDLKAKYLREIEDLRIKQAAATAKLKELEAASEDTWDHVKMTADKTWNDLKTSVSNATYRFRSVH